MKYFIFFLLLFCGTYCIGQTVIISGAAKIGQSSGAPEAGTIRWNGSKFEGWDGTHWLAFSNSFVVSQTGDTLSNGNNWVIIPGISAANPPIIYDLDGNYYHTIHIGNQTWFLENLRTSKYSDGSPIPYATSMIQWQNAAASDSPAYCWYNYNQQNNFLPYGGLYNAWSVLPTSNGSKNLCPNGWHVPSLNDFFELRDFLGGNVVAGGKLKETGTVHWQAPNTGASNVSGFTGVPAGFCSGGVFSDKGYYNYLWCSIPYNSFETNFRKLSYDDPYFDATRYDNDTGFSVRCVKD